MADNRCPKCGQEIESSFMNPGGKICPNCGYNSETKRSMRGRSDVKASNTTIKTNGQ